MLATQLRLQKAVRNIGNVKLCKQLDDFSSHLLVNKLAQNKQILVFVLFVVGVASELLQVHVQVHKVLDVFDAFRNKFKRNVAVFSNAFEVLQNKGKIKFFLTEFFGQLKKLLYCLNFVVALKHSLCYLRAFFQQI